MIYENEPKEFSPKFEVVSCFCQNDGNFILLLRQDHKSEGNKWGVPAGKVNAGEIPIEAMKRELREETGIEVNLEDLTCSYKLFVKYPDYDFVYYIFSTNLDSKKEIVIEPNEHKDGIWITPQKAIGMDLIEDLDTCIEMLYKKTD